MGSEELADNIFRIAQTDAKLKRDNVDNEYTADSIHYEVGKEVRNSIKIFRKTHLNYLLSIKLCLTKLLYNPSCSTSSVISSQTALHFSVPLPIQMPISTCCRSSISLSESPIAIVDKSSNPICFNKISAASAL